MKSIKEPQIPTIIKMFLDFGYVDAALAGHENADYLYSIADSFKGDPDNGVYTFREWLTAIYQGKRPPSRDEFDMDYAAHMQELRLTHKIDAAEEARRLKDNEAKALFELEKIFPTVNKLTYGRISIFCPLFADHNVQRALETSMVTPELLKQTFDGIRAIDFSAYYRETIYSNPGQGIEKETIHVEILPEVILMPNVGTRGMMWQEIEGRVRATPSRMFIPLFLLDDLRNLITRLTGEFRWEMCKRIQGVRWQDMSDPSLTSEYCDYLQFYRSNRDLSADVKASVKSELTRARNNYKAVFVSNYSEWLMFEANGSPRLNRHARRMLMAYCPFSAEIREKLTLNPEKRVSGIV